jgi:outer membrane usher protein
MNAYKKKKIALLISALLCPLAHADTDTGSYKVIIENDTAHTIEERADLLIVEDRFYMTRRDVELRKLKFKQEDITVIEGQEVIDLSRFGTITDNGATLLLRARPESLTAVDYNLNPLQVRSPMKYESSAFMNYSVERGNRGRATAVNTSFYKTFDTGVLYNLNTNYNSATGRLNLLDAYRESYDRTNLTTTRIGTSYSGSNSVTNPVAFVGVQFKKDYSLDYNYLKNPYLSIAGTADVKSFAELYVNDRNLGRVPMDGGSYNLSNFSTGQTSSNDVKLIVKDINGNVQQVQTASLVGAPYNLAKGISSYSIEAGRFRNGNSLGDVFSSGTYAYGVSNQVTLEGHYEVSKDQKRVGFNSTYATALGTFQYGAAIGAGEHLQKGAYSYQKGDFFTTVALVRAARFNAFGNAYTNIKNQNIVSMGYRVGDTNIGLQHAQIDGAGQRTSLNLSRNFGRVTASMSLEKSSIGGFGVSFFVSMPLDSKNEWRSFNTVRSTSSGTSIENNLYRVGQYNDWNVNLNTSRQENGDKAFNGTYQNSSQYGVVTAQASSSGTAYGRMEGSLVLEKGLHLSRPIYQGYALVDTGGTENVPVSLNGVPVAKTGSSGYAVIPNITANMDNYVSVNNALMPMGVQVDDGTRRLAIQNYFKRDVVFKVKKNPVLLSLNKKLNTETVQIDGKDFYVVDGQIYFDDYAAEQTYQINEPGCHVSFKVPKTAQLNDEIQLTCEENTK